jgi:hypothetical protein
MDGWVDYLHLGFLGEHILLRSLRLHSFWEFLLSSVLITVVCLSERYLYSFRQLAILILMFALGF